MIVGLSASTFTAVHVAVSLIAIASGALALPGTFRAGRVPALTTVFLLASAATSVTGFFFLSTQLGIGHVIGVLSLVTLAPTALALYRYRLAGRWRWVYLGGAATVLYLNAFIAVWQAFRKVAILSLLAPTPAAAPFLVAHFAVLAIVVALVAVAAKRFNPRRSATTGLGYSHGRPGSWSWAMRDEQVSAALLQSSTVRRR